PTCEGRGGVRRPLRNGPDPRRCARAPHPCVALRTRCHRRSRPFRRPPAGGRARMVTGAHREGSVVVLGARGTRTIGGRRAWSLRRTRRHIAMTTPTSPIALDRPADELSQRFTHAVTIDERALERLRAVCTTLDVDLEARVNAGRDWWPLTMLW